jgi:hypothetical protein
MKRSPLDFSTQILLPTLTLSGQLAIAVKFPQWGLLLSLASQPFWIYSSWKSYKEAKQIGMLINTIVFVVITIFGVINYWFLK